MPKQEYPTCSVFTLCDKVNIDPSTQKVDLDGLFGTIYAPRFPAAHPHFSIFMRLTGSTGEWLFLIKFQKPDSIETLGSIQIKLDFRDDKNNVVQHIINLQRLPFPKPGKYAVQLFCRRPGQDESKEELIASTNLIWDERK